MSELINCALRDGPQTITRHGKPTVVMVSSKAFRQWAHPRKPLSEALRESPLRGTVLAFERDRSAGRDIELK